MFSAFISFVILSKLCSASGIAQVYVHPSVSSLTPSRAPALLAQCLGLEAFEFIPREASTGETVLGKPSAFVGEGRHDVLLVSIDTSHPDDVLPQSLEVSFVLPTKFHSTSSLINRYTRLALQIYPYVSDSSVTTSQPQAPSKFLDVFSLSASSPTVNSVVLEKFLTSLSGLVTFVEESQEHNMTHRFGAFEVKGLEDIRQQWGRESEVYVTAAMTLKAAIQSAMVNNFSLAVLIPSHLKPREIDQPPQSPLPPPAIPSTAPVFSTSTCFATADACQNATATCSSRGECVSATRAGRTCFVCQCRKEPLKEGGKNVSWAGDMCQKQDISQQFTLIVATVIGLILIVSGSIALLYTLGGQELPGTLIGGLSGHLKAE